MARRHRSPALVCSLLARSTLGGQGGALEAARRVSFSHAARGLATGQAEAGPTTEPEDKEATFYQK